MRIIGIDPGPAETAYCVIDELKMICAEKLPNDEFLSWLRRLGGVEAAAVEGIQSYGMPVGREVFDTCYMVGRIMEICDHQYIPAAIYNRPEYSKALCGCGKITDAVLRAALMTRFGGDKKGEPLHQLKGSTDKRSAFAIAVYHHDIAKYGRVADAKG